MSVDKFDHRAGLSLGACFSGIRLNATFETLAINTEFLPQNSMAKMIAAGTGITLSCVFPIEQQHAAVARITCYCKSSCETYVLLSGVITANRESVLDFDNVHKLIVKVSENQTLPPKLATVVNTLIAGLQPSDPEVSDTSDATEQATSDRTTCTRSKEYLEFVRGVYPFEKDTQTLTFEDILAETTQARILRDQGDFRKIEEAAASITHNSFSSVQFLHAILLADGENQNLTKLYSLADSGQPAAQHVAVAQKLETLETLKDYPFTEESFYERLDDSWKYRAIQLVKTENEASVNNFIARGWEHLKTGLIPAQIVSWDYCEGKGVALRKFFTKALEECTDDRDVIKPWLTHFSVPTTSEINGTWRLWFMVNQDLLLQLLIELRAAQRAKAFAEATA